LRNITFSLTKIWYTLPSCDRNVVSNFSVCYTHPINISLHFKCRPLISSTVGVQALIEEDRSRSINWYCCSYLKCSYITDGRYLRVKSSNVCSQYRENLQWHVHRFEWILFCQRFGNYVQHTSLFFLTVQKFDSLVWIKCKIFCRKSYFSCTYQFEYTFNLKILLNVHKHVLKRV
jgi:hypothetical protein